MNQQDIKSLCYRVRALWEQSCDTKDMSKALQVSEADCERALHQALEKRRAVVASLGKSE